MCCSSVDNFRKINLAESVSYNVEPIRMYIGSSCHTPLAKTDEVARPSHRIVGVVTVSIEKIRDRRYESKRKYKWPK